MGAVVGANVRGNVTFELYNLFLRGRKHTLPVTSVLGETPAHVFSIVSYTKPGPKRANFGTRLGPEVPTVVRAQDLQISTNHLENG